MTLPVTSGLILRLSSQSGTSTTTNGAAVASWTDTSSGSGLVVSQSNSGQQPVYVAVAGPRQIPAIYFGPPHSLERAPASDLLVSAAVTAVVVASMRPTDVNPATFFSAFGADGFWYLQASPQTYGGFAGVGQVEMGTGGTSNTGDPSVSVHLPVSIPFGTPVCVVGTVESPNMRLRFCGLETPRVVIANDVVSTSADLWMNPSDMDVFEILWYNRVLSAEETQSVESWAVEEYGAAVIFSQDEATGARVLARHRTGTVEIRKTDLVLDSLAVQDTFTDTAGTSLFSHTGETGATWVLEGLAGSTDPVVTANGTVVFQTEAQSVLAVASADPLQDLEIRARVVPTTVGLGSISLLARLHTTDGVLATRYYQLYVLADAVYLGRMGDVGVGGGGGVNLGSLSYPGGARASVEVTWQLFGARHYCWADGDYLGMIEDVDAEAILDAGLVGLGFDGDAAADAEVDWIEARPVLAPAREGLASRSLARRLTETLQLSTLLGRATGLLARLTETLQLSTLLGRATGLLALWNEIVQAVTAPVDVGFQIAEPVADVSDGGWTASDANGNLAAMIDEEVASDADYIQSGATPVDDTCRLTLKAINPPLDGGTVVIVLRHRQGA